MKTIREVKMIAKKIENRKFCKGPNLSQIKVIGSRQEQIRLVIKFIGIRRT